MLLKVIEVSITVGIMIGALILLFPILNKKFSAKWRYWIWILLSIRLIFPFDIDFSKPLVVLTSPIFVQNHTTYIDDTNPFKNLPSTTENYLNNSEKKTVSVNNVISHEELNITYILWITGAIFLLVYRFAGYLIFRKNLLRWGTVSENATIEIILEDLKKEMILKTDIMLIISERAPSPMVLGFFKVILVLPSNQYCEEDLKVILKHELIHVKRQDVWYKLLMTIAVSIHWFNPLVYLMENSASRDLEISCDEELVKGKDIEYRKLYSEAILRAIDFKKVYNCTFLNYWGGKKMMKQRFQNILNQNKKNKGIITASAIVLTVAISGNLVACSSNKSGSISSSKQIESTNASSTAGRNTGTDNGQKDKTAETSKSKPETGLTYKTESDFLNSPEGVNFQKIAYKSAKAYLSGDLKQMSKYFVEPKDASLKTENIFNNLEYMILKWNLGDIKSENEINASYEFKVNGEDSISYITMELKKVDNNWKVKSIALEK